MAGSRPLLVASAVVLVVASVPGSALGPAEAPWEDEAREMDGGISQPSSAPGDLPGATEAPGPDAPGPCRPGSLLAGDACSLWTSRRDEDGKRDFGGAQAVGSDGTLYVVARDEGHLSAVAYAPRSGNASWSRTLDLPGEVVRGPFGFGVTASATVVGGVLVAAMEFTDPAGGPTRIQLAGLSTTDGTTLWTRSYEASAGGGAEPMALFPDDEGTALLALRAFGDDPRTRPELAALDAGDGSVAWSVEPDPVPDHHDYPDDVAHDPERGLVVFSGTSYTEDFDDYEAFVTAVDTDGITHAWSRAWAGSASQQGIAVAAAPEGSGIYTVVENSDEDRYEVRALEPGNGTERWTRFHHPREGEVDDEAAAAVGSHGETLFVKVDVWPHGDAPSLARYTDTLAFDADDGEVRWRNDERVPATRNVQTMDLVAPEGSSCAFALDVSLTKSRFSDYRVVGYNQSTGEQVWTRYMGSLEQAWADEPGDLTWNDEEALLHVTGSLRSRPLDSPVRAYVLGQWLPLSGASGGWSAATATYAPAC